MRSKIIDLRYFVNFMLGNDCKATEFMKFFFLRYTVGKVLIKIIWKIKTSKLKNE